MICKEISLEKKKVTKFIIIIIIIVINIIIAIIFVELSYDNSEPWGEKKLKKKKNRT